MIWVTKEFVTHFSYVGNIVLDISGMPAKSSSGNKSAKAILPLRGYSCVLCPLYAKQARTRLQWMREAEGGALK